MAGQKLACSLSGRWGPSPSLFSSGRTIASLNSAGKQPVVQWPVIIKAIKGETSPLMSLTSHVGAGSSWHVLFGAELISFATSSTDDGDSGESTFSLECMGGRFPCAILAKKIICVHKLFTARCYASAVLAVALCPSVCPSQVGVLLKQLNVRSHKQHRTIAQGL